MATDDSLSQQTERNQSRLEVDDPQHCKECGLEIEIDVSGVDGMAYNPVSNDYEQIEKCAACYAEEMMRHVSHRYQSNVAFDVSVRGIHTESRVVGDE